MQEDTFEITSSKIEFKSQDGKFYTEGILEVANEVDVVGDMCTEKCIDSIVSQCMGTNVKAVTSTNATRKLMKLSADHAHLIPELGGDRREMPVGKIIDAKKITENGKAKAWIKTEVNEFHPEFASIKGCIENGYFDAYSIEYIPIDATQIDKNKRILNDVKLTGAAFTGRPVLQSAIMTDFYAKSMTFEQFKSVMDKEKEPKKEDCDDAEYKKEYDIQKKEHPTLPDGYLVQIVKDHLKLKSKGDKMTEGKSETVVSEPKSEKVEVKSKVEDVVEVAKSVEEAKSKDLMTAEQIKAIVAEEIKKAAEESKSKVLIVKEDSKASPYTFIDSWKMSKGIKG